MTSPALILRLACAWIAMATAAAHPAAVDYLTQIKPILEKRCYSCHGAVKQKGKFRLDTVSFMLAKRDEPAVLPGKSESSVLYHAITGTHEVTLMPKEGKPLAEAEISLIKAWIDQGAAGPADEKPMKDPARHWAFLPPVKPAVPRIAGEEWSSNPIDAFIAAEFQKRNITPQPIADRRTLIRRVYLDLIGLPPTPAEVERFLTDTSVGAWEKVVDDLLGRPQYGERWGRHWMDVWRYADWAGYKAELRESAKHIWRWRDWIVQSLNSDAPYNQMIRLMLAADEIAPTDPQALAATGFLARNYFRYNRNVWMENAIEHTSKAFLGLTMACCRCHDHMYDPISQEEYYHFRAFFEPHQLRTDHVPRQADTNLDGLPRIYDGPVTPTILYERGDEARPREGKTYDPALPQVFGANLKITPVKLPVEAWYPAVRPFEREQAVELARADVAKKKAALEARKKDAKKKITPEDIAIAEKQIAAAELNVTAVQAAVKADEAKYADPPAADAQELAMKAGELTREANKLLVDIEVLIAEKAVTEVKKTDPKLDKGSSRLLQKTLNEAKKKRKDVYAQAKKPAAEYAPLGPVYPAESTGRRTALADWIAADSNPLTARVAANHLWMRHLGAPLVPSVFDFGLNGKAPTHPGLLDYLACRLVEDRWSMKKLHKLIVTSRVYQLSAALGPADQPARKIDPDNVLYWHFNSRRLEGESVRDCLLAAAGNLDATLGGPDIDSAQSMTGNRRSIYYRHAQEKFSEFLLTFDGASVTECYRRTETVVPQQALALANSPLALAQARRLAQSINESAGTGPMSDEAYIRELFARTLSRPPTAAEARMAAEFLQSQSQLLADPARLGKFQGVVKTPVEPAASPADRAREDLAHVLLNHNEFIMIR